MGFVGTGDGGIVRTGGMIGYQALFSNDKFAFEGAIGPAIVLGEDTGNTVLPIFSLNLGIRLDKKR